MIALASGARVWLATGHTDMRKGFDSLALLVQPAGDDSPASRVALRDVEIALIRKAVADARGNVARAAQALGISRATVYRKLSQKQK